ncbi:MAG: hypothetical protein MPJ50_00775 [Pirellulales bacterium]|nr:hypothetical protein [Pirellulales bacterium]
MWQYCRDLHADQTPYAFVLYGLEDIPSLSAHVLTEESLTQVAEEYIAKGHYETLDESRDELRYSIEEPRRKTGA